MVQYRLEIKSPGVPSSNQIFKNYLNKGENKKQKYVEKAPLLCLRWQLQLSVLLHPGVSGTPSSVIIFMSLNTLLLKKLGP